MNSALLFKQFDMSNYFTVFCSVYTYIYMAMPNLYCSEHSHCSIFARIYTIYIVIVFYIDPTSLLSRDTIFSYYLSFSLFLCLKLSTPSSFVAINAIFH